MATKGFVVSVKKKADVVEQGKDYCAEHYCQKSTGLTLEQLKQEDGKVKV